VKRIQALESVAKGELDRCLIPEEKESHDQDHNQDEDPEDQEDEDEKDVLDSMKERQYGTRKSDRKRSQPTLHGYQISSSQIALSGDSDA
jgi:hypothetical protein